MITLERNIKLERKDKMSVTTLLPLSEYLFLQNCEHKKHKHTYTQNAKEYGKCSWIYLEREKKRYIYLDQY